jgi:hypothetical protein
VATYTQTVRENILPLSVAGTLAGIATEPVDHTSRSEDLAYLDVRHWDEAAQEDARELQRNTGLMTNLTKKNYHDNEYPRPPRPTSRKPTNRNRKRNAIKQRRDKWKV